MKFDCVKRGSLKVHDCYYNASLYITSGLICVEVIFLGEYIIFVFGDTVVTSRQQSLHECDLLSMLF